jgi:hypothetical protein
MGTSTSAGRLLRSSPLVDGADVGRVDALVEAAGAGSLFLVGLGSVGEMRIVGVRAERAAHARRLVGPGGLPGFLDATSRGAAVAILFGRLALAPL